MSTVLPELSERTTQLHRRSVVIDALDVSRFGESHFRKMQQGGITAAIVTVIMPSLHFRQAVEGVREFDLLVERHADLVMPIRSVADIATAKATGKVGLIYDFQNALPIEGDLRLITVFHSLGVRVIQITYNTANFVGDGCLEPRNGGLTVFGRAVVREMNRTGILVDLSHVGERTSLDAVDASALPVAITHCCARTLVDHPRNKSDEVIRAVAARGGVIGLTSVCHFVCDFTHKVPPTIEQYLRQIDYIANLVGIDHVGIGMDYTEGLSPDFVYTPTWGGVLPAADTTSVNRDVWPQPYAIPDSSQFALVTEGLLARGYTEADVQKILGANWVRLFQETWTP
ncbi:MAG: membrane dipeptidase [Chloroflexi bacterium]|nr:membrane dipeptidase [Chloroflexota bacterium]